MGKRRVYLGPSDSQANADALARRSAPYAQEHQASKAGRMAPPRDLLGWFLREFRAEMPTEIHAAGVWRDYIPLAVADTAVGGSLLGSPRYDDGFRRFIEDDPFALEVAELEGHQDRSPHYRFPIRAALARLSGRGRPNDPYPFMARVLYRTALRDGDWDSACASLGIVEPVRSPYVKAALERLWSRYEVQPPLLREGAAA